MLVCTNTERFILLEIFVARIVTMNPFNIHWKHYIIPSGIVLMSLWMLSIGAVALFKPIATSGDGDTDPRAARTRSLEHQVLSVRSHQSASTSRVKTTTKASSKAQVKTTGGGKKNTSAAKNSQAKKVIATGARTTPKQLALLSQPALSKVIVKKMQGPDPRIVLRDSIMAEAFSLAMKSEQPWENLIEIAKTQFSQGEKEAARDVLIMAEKLAANPDDQVNSSVAIREVVKTMLSQKLNDDALAALQNIQNRSEREQAMSEIAAYSAREGRVDLARILIGKILNAGARDVALVAIAESEASYEGASKAIQTVGAIVSARKKDDAYQRIALKRAIAKDFTLANQVVQLVKSDKLKNATLASLARYRTKQGDPAGGLNTLQQVNDPIVADSALRELSADLARLGQYSSSAYVTTRIRGEVEKSYALELLSVEQARSGDLRGSLIRTSAISMKSIRERALRSVSTVTADNGYVGRARNVVVRIDSQKERNRAYRGIAQASAVDGNHVAAYNILQDINQPDEKALALVSMARTRHKQGDTRQALTLLEDAGREAKEVSSVTALDLIQSYLAMAYAECDESGRSLRLAHQISNLARRDATYGSLARTLVGGYDVHGAQESVAFITSDKIRLKAGDDVARTFARRVAPQNALSRSRVLLSSRQRMVFLLEMSKKT